MERKHEPAVVVHGGAWCIPDEAVAESRLGVKSAARNAMRVLLDGGSAVDAVQAAVMAMEDNPVFHAGNGSSLNANGDVEMDAVIMDGRDLNAGAVAGVQNIANPVKLARLVMEKTPHNLLVGAGANEFATQEGIETVPTEQLVTKTSKDELEAVRGKFDVTVNDLYNRRSTPTAQKDDKATEKSGVAADANRVGCDTVGAVAIDRLGNVAFATSTGGITGKRPGRVGDSPIIGQGGYADNLVGAVSATGHGESIAKVCLSHHAITLMRQGIDGQKAAEESLKNMHERLGSCGGLIVVDCYTGKMAHYCTSERMAWASASRGLLHHGIDRQDDFVEQL